jgi:hypothetical protein
MEGKTHLRIELVKPSYGFLHSACFYAFDDTHTFDNGSMIDIMR